MYRYLTSMFFLLIFSNSASGAEITNFFKKTGDICISLIVIKGEIKFGDSEKLLQNIEILDKKIQNIQIVDKIYCSQPDIAFDSEGGDVNEAIKIGKIIRLKELSTRVYKPDRCFSACVLSYAGGIFRIGDGKIGVHRPYFENLSPNETVENIKNRRDATILNMRTYLDQMDVNVSLIDLMMSINPENMKILNDEELLYYRLYGEDGNFQEKRIAKQASNYGTTSSIMRKRIEEGKKCFTNSIDHDCLEAAYWGLSQYQYKQRVKYMSENFYLCKDTYDQCRTKLMNGGKP